MKQSAGNISRIKWVYISGAVFILFLILALFLIIYADRLGQFGITKSFYYIILIPVGLCAAAFLFGAMHSRAKYIGKNPYGQLELTGPVVVFALVVVGGFYFAEPDSSFLLTIRVTENNQIIKHGSVILDLGDQRLKRDIGENGEVLFAGLSSKFIGKEIKIIPQVDGYITGSSSLRIPEDKIIYLELNQEEYNTSVRGTVMDENGNPLPGVKINFESGLAICESDEMGNFKINLPAKSGSSMLVTASLNGVTGYRDYVVLPESGSLTIAFNGREL